MAIITTISHPARAPSENGSALRFRPAWHLSAPKALRHSEDAPETDANWRAWSRHLGRRRRPRPPADRMPHGRSALAWGLTPALLAGDAPLPTGVPATRDLLLHLDRVERGKKWAGPVASPDLAAVWLDDATHRRGAAFGLECLAWSRAMPALARHLPPRPWWALAEALLAWAEEREPKGAAGPLALAWQQAELPLTLAYLFPEVVQLRRLAQPGHASLTAGMEALIQPDGTPAQSILHVAQPLLATWTRARALARWLEDVDWDDDDEARYRRFVGQMLRLARRSGGSALCPDPCESAATLFAAALDGASTDDRRLASATFPGLPGGRRRAPGPPASPALHNEEAGVAVLRPNWRRSCERLTVAFGGHDVRTELSVGRDVLWSGAWGLEVCLDGKLLRPEHDARWDEVCWTSDEDADYLELEIALPEGLRVQRQILLAREDHFLLMADAVLGEQPAAIAYRGWLPLDAETAFDASTETREGYLIGAKPRALAFPLALPEWRTEVRQGSLDATDRGLELRQSHPAARRLYAPLFFDLDPRRMFRPATWRTLTVVESRQVQAAESAVGYRVQAGKEQWLLYRSLGPRGNRTLLGQNVVCEFLVARFTQAGETEPLLEIE